MGQAGRRTRRPTTEDEMALFKVRKPAGKPGEWFYCLKHQAAEEGPQCASRDRFGPYATKAEAEHAMQIAQERNREWDTDPRWNDRES
jgi:hypothetical protein